MNDLSVALILMLAFESEMAPRLLFPLLLVALLWEEVFKGWIWLEEVSNWAEARGAFERSNPDTLLPVRLPEK